MIAADVQRDIQSKRGFTHGRTTGDDNELTVMHTARHTVEIREARASAGDIARVVNLGEFAKMIRVIGQNRVDFLETAGRAGQILTDAKDFCLSFVQQILGFASARIHGVIDDVVTGCN